jgi:site-specific recombinase XerD
MLLNPNLPTSRTLLGAVHAYLRELWPLRPHVVELYEEVLLDFTSHWLAEADDNGLEAVNTNWLTEYLLVASERALTYKVLRSFFQWAVVKKLIQNNPLYRPLDYPVGDIMGYTAAKLLETS